MTEPTKNPCEDRLELIGLESPQLPNRSDIRVCRYALCQECPWLQEWDIDANLVLGAAEAGGVREDRDQGSVYVANKRR